MTERSDRAPFVPDSFVPPAALDTDPFRLRPLGPQHNESDYAAWTSSMDHIRRTPGFTDGDWPRPMTSEENRGDLERHASDFVAREGFTYTVLAPTADEVIGCVYIYPAREGGGARVSSWVRAQDADLDEPLYFAVSGWLAREWPFERIAYDTREPELPPGA
jgi:hypothetical protein